MATPYFEAGGITIYHGDSREILAALPTDSANLLLTDPPYGMAYKSAKTQGTVRGDGRWAAMRLVRSVMLDIDRVLASPAHAYVFCHWESLPEFYDLIAPFWQLKNALVWSKGSYGTGDLHGDYAHDYELCLFAHSGRRRLNDGRDLAVRHVPTVPHRQRVHPTQKPVELLEHYVTKSSDAGELVLDPFMGSAATLKAAAKLGRRAVGIELDERYCEHAAEAIEQLLAARAAGDVIAA